MNVLTLGFFDFFESFPFPTLMLSPQGEVVTNKAYMQTFAHVADVQEVLNDVSGQGNAVQEVFIRNQYFQVAAHSWKESNNISWTLYQFIPLGEFELFPQVRMSHSTMLSKLVHYLDNDQEKIINFSDYFVSKIAEMDYLFQVGNIQIDLENGYSDILCKIPLHHLDELIRPLLIKVYEVLKDVGGNKHLCFELKEASDRIYLSLTLMPASFDYGVLRDVFEKLENALRPYLGKVKLLRSQTQNSTRIELSFFKERGVFKRKKLGASVSHHAKLLGHS